MSQATSGTTAAVPAHAPSLPPGALRRLHEAPGLLLVDVVEHHASRRTSAHEVTVNLRCSWSGWTSTRAAESHRTVLTALADALAGVPFRTIALDFGTHAALDGAVHDWAAEHDVLVFADGTPVREVPGVVDGLPDLGSLAALESVNRRWALVNDKANFLVPLRRTTGWTTDSAGRRRPVRDAPRTPFARVLQSGVLPQAQADALRARRDSLDPGDTIRAMRPGQRIDLWSRALRR